MWIDSRKQIRRQKISQSVREPNGGTTTSSTITLELYDFGTPVKVSAPPASQVTDLARLLANAGPSSSHGSAVLAPGQSSSTVPGTRASPERRARHGGSGPQ